MSPPVETLRAGRLFPTVSVVASDIGAVYGALVFAFLVRGWGAHVLDLVPLTYGITFYLAKWWVAALVVLLLAYLGGYGIAINVWDDLLVIMKGVCAAFLVAWVVLSLQKESESVSRLVVTLWFAGMLLFIPVFRFVVRYVMFRSLGLKRKALLLGGLEGEGGEIADLMNREWYSGYDVIPWTGSLGSIRNLETCFLHISMADDATVRELKSKVRNLVVVTEISGLSFMDAEVKTFLSENITLITSGNGLLSIRKTALKRTFDVLASLLALITLAPLFLLIGICIRLESRGPVFFLHKRCGRGMKDFNMIKFRTMRDKGEGLLEQYLKENPEASREWKEKNKIKKDPRITRLGKMLRKTSLDELPQLINVVKGEMSIVGPRPDTREAVRDYYEEYRDIYGKVKPGVTGLWQVSGRSDVGYEKRVKLDFLYVLNWSLWLDLVIILKTIKTILSGKGAY